MFTMKILETMNLKTVKLCLINLMFLVVKNTSTDQQNLDTFRDILVKTEYNRIFFESMKRIFMRSHITGMRISFYLQQEETKTGGFYQGVETERQETVDESNLQHRGLFFYRESINSESSHLEKKGEAFFPGVVYVSNGIVKLLIAEPSEEPFNSDKEKANIDNIICYINGTKGKASCLFIDNLPSFLEIGEDLYSDLTLFSHINHGFMGKESNDSRQPFQNECLAYPNLVNFDSYSTFIHLQILTEREIEELKNRKKDLETEKELCKNFFYTKSLDRRMSYGRPQANKMELVGGHIDPRVPYKKEIEKKLSKALDLLDYIERKRKEFLERQTTQTKKNPLKFRLCSSNETYEHNVLQCINDYTRIFSCLCKILLESKKSEIFIDFDEANFIKLEKFEQSLNNFIQLYKDINEIFLRKMKLLSKSTEMKITLQIAFFINFHMSRIDTLLWEINNLIINAFLNKQNNNEFNKNSLDPIFLNCNNFITILLDLFENFIDFIYFLEILHHEISNSGSVCLFSEHEDEEYINCFQSHYFLNLEFNNIVASISNNKTSDSKDELYEMKFKEKNMLSHVMKQFTLLHINKEINAINNLESENSEENEGINFDSHVKVNFEMKNKKFSENIFNELKELKSTLNSLDKLLSTPSLSQEIEMFRNQKLKAESDKANKDKEKLKDAEFDNTVINKESHSKSDEEKNTKEKNDQFKSDETGMNEVKFDEIDKRKLLYGFFERITNILKAKIKEIDFFQRNFDSNINNLLLEIQDTTTRYNTVFAFLEFAQGDHKSLLVIIKFVFETLIQIFDDEIHSGRSNDLFIPPDILDIFWNLNETILNICEEVSIFFNTSVISLSDYQKWIKIWYEIDIQGINMRKHRDFALKNNCRFFHKEENPK